MQIYRKVERVTEQACIYDVKILWSRYMVCVASLERYFTSVGLFFSSWKIDIMSKTTKKSWKIIYFDFSGLFSCVDCRNQYVMLGVNSFKETTFAFDVLVLRRVKVHQNCFGHNISHIYFIFAFFRGFLMFFFFIKTWSRESCFEDFQLCVN